MSVPPEPSAAPAITLLLVCSLPVPAALGSLAAALRPSGADLRVATLQEAIALLDAPGGFAAVLCVAETPDDAVLEGLERLVQCGPPVLLLAAEMTDALQVGALRRGVSECLTLAPLDAPRLFAAVERAIARTAHIHARIAHTAETWRALGGGHLEAPEGGSRFTEFAQHAPVQMWLENADRSLIWENATALEFTGRSWSEEAGYGWLDTVHPDDRPRVEEHYRQTTLEQRGFTLEFRMRRNDGVYRHLLQIAIPRWASDGTLAGFLGVDVDVSELEERRDRLAQAESRYRQIAESVPVIVWMDDADHGLIYQNRIKEEYSGRSLPDRKGDAWYEEIHPEDRDRVKESYASTMASPVPYQLMYRIRRADGVYRWFIEIGVPRYGAGGELSGFIGVDVDIHEIKEASLRLEETETRYRNFIELSTEGIWRFENQPPIPLEASEEEQVRLFLDHSYLAECNAAMAAMYGYERPEELLGRTLRQFVLPGDLPGIEKFLLAFIRSGYRLSEAESSEHDRHGRPRYFLNNLVGVVEAGFLVRSWGTQRDISERRILEEEARQARKMETAGRLAGGIAHDFNNLLTAILGTSEVLLQDLPQGAPERDDIGEIKKAATRAANLTRQLLAFSRRQVLQPRVLDVAAVVQGVETMLRRLIGEDIVLTTRTCADLWRVRADPGQLEQVIVNLCVNARDAMPTGGSVVIETDNHGFEGSAHGEESVMPAGDYIRLTVSDTGAGMDPETQRHLFEPFFTTKELGKGTGLGLATVYGIVKQSGGFIYAASEPGQGSRFRIFLPRVSGALEPIDEEKPTAPPASAEGTLLLVEDEDAVRRLARRVLEGVGYHVLEAANGPAALRLVDELTGPLDLVVTDVVMPGMSGQELSARLRQKRPSLRILYVSGYTDDAILQHGTMLPNTSFLQKPFTPSTLAQRVREVMAS